MDQKKSNMFWLCYWCCSRQNYGGCRWICAKICVLRQFFCFRFQSHFVLPFFPPLSGHKIHRLGPWADSTESPEKRKKGAKKVNHNKPFLQSDNTKRIQVCHWFRTTSCYHLSNYSLLVPNTLHPIMMDSSELSTALTTLYESLDNGSKWMTTLFLESTHFQLKKNDW